MVIVLANDKSDPGRKLTDICKNIIPENKLLCFPILKELACSLTDIPISKIDVIILMAENQETLDELVSMHNDLSELKIILILPDDRDETISKGHRLYPRFISYMGNNTKNMEAVLKKMSACFKW